MGTFFRRTWYLLRRSRHDADLRAEIEAHRALRQDQLERDGLSPAEAAAASRRALGNIPLAREDAHRVWLAPWLESVWQDAGYAVRGLARSPVHSLSALLALVLGIGLNVTLFSVANGLFLRPWAVPDPDRFFVVHDQHVSPQFGLVTGSVSPVEFQFLREHARTIDLASLGMYGFSVDGNDNGTPVRLVSDNYFDVLKFRLVLGRGFRPDENDRAHPALVAVIGYRLWQDRYAGAESVLGQTIRVNDVPVTIVGVADADVIERPMSGPPQVWMPVAVSVPLRYAHRTPEELQQSIAEDLAGDEASKYSDWGLDVLGRLRNGVTKASAQAELAVLDQRFRLERPDASRRMLLTSTATISDPNPNLALGPIYLIFVGSILLLVLACANVGNLYLARAVARRGEIAIRLGLGASRPRLVRQLLTEGLVLSMAASALSGFLAVALPVLLRHFVPADIGPHWWPIGPDRTVFGVAVGLGLASCLLSALLPALRSTRDVATGRYALGHSHAKLRSTLLAAQVALGMVLLLGAGLLARGIGHADMLDLGFNLQGTSVVSVQVPANYDPDRVKSLPTRLDDVLRTAQLSQVAESVTVPLETDTETTVRRPEQSEQASLFVSQNVVSAAFFDVLRIPLVAGQIFLWNGPNTDVVVNETLAATMWPHQSALGQMLVKGNQTFRVVGVVKDALLADLERARPTIFMRGTATNFLVPRDALGTIEALKGLIASVNPDVTVTVWSLSNVIREQVVGTVVGAWAAAALGALALILASVGTFGVFSYVVIERTREIGVRMALGAGRADVLRLVMSRSVRAVGAGLVVGGLLSLVLSPVLQSYLYGLSPHDPVAYAAVVAVLVAAAVIASALPAWRAMRVDPAVSLRHE